MLKSNLSSDSRERIISSTRAMAQDLSFDENNRNIRAIRSLIRSLRTKNIAVMLAVWPVHPRVLNNLSPDLIDKTDATLKEIAQENACVYIRYSNLLSENDFSDALHPNTEGRTKLSTKLAIEIKSLSAKPNKI